MRETANTVTKKEFKVLLVLVLLFFACILMIAAGLNIKNSVNLRNILADSVKSQLISISITAREMIDIEAFMAYTDDTVAELPAYQETLHKLRALANSVGANYIYALKRQGDHYVFVFDTDEEDPSIFIPYELSPVHEAAFAGRNVADIMNVEDEYGSFNTGAVPLIHNGQVVGIISTDIEDTYLASSYNTALWNAILLLSILFLVMAVVFVLIVRLFRRIRVMQGKLERQALYDAVTGLPNRQYLMDYLTWLTQDPDKTPFGLFFIDLDNFKTVNDKAGHDAGDELLRQIADYLDASTANAKSFRPSPGRVNIAARVGGDEFIQVVVGVDTHEKAADVALQLLEGLKTANVSRYAEKYNVGLSIGAALFPYDTSDYHVLIKYADIAMYNAKHGGKNQYRLYVDEMGQEKTPYVPPADCLAPDTLQAEP